MSRKRIKQYLMLLTVVGLIAVAANGSGTFASFNAVVGNSGNTFATGSLLLDESLTGDTTATTTCNSKADSNNQNSTCTAAINLANAKPGDVSTDTFKLTNGGTIDAAGGLNLTSTGCTHDIVGTSLGFNTGNLCDGIRLYVELDDADGTPISCLYGDADSGNADACDTTFSNATKTLSDFTVTYLATAANQKLVATVPAATTEGQENTPSPASNVYQVKFGLTLPNGSAGNENVYQDTTATFPLSWTLTQ
jgi:hypothetical protein